MSVNSGLKTTKIIGQRKAFYRQRIPGFSCARKETVDIDILVTSRNGDRKIVQSIRIIGFRDGNVQLYTFGCAFFSQNIRQCPAE